LLDSSLEKEAAIARIPDEVLERLKREVSVERLAEARGVTLRPHGADRIGLCCFHRDTQPSLVVTPSKNLWHCLGACGAGGSVIDWVMKAEGVSFRHAVEILRSDLPSLAASSARPVKQSTVPKLPSPVERSASDRELLAQVVAYYHETLKQSPEALGYLERRGLGSSEIVGRFKLGYSNRTLGLRLPAKNRKSGEEIRGRLQALGLLRESGHEHFNGSLVIPIFDEAGNVTEIYGRKIVDHLRPGTPLHLYLRGRHRGVWNIEALAAAKEVILCEALIDALTFWCAGYRNVTASYGTEGFTADHLEAFQRYGTRRVLIAYDRDQAGENATPGLVEKLTARGIDCYRIQFPRGMDANEYALKVQPPEKSLGVVIRAAVWLGKGEAPARELAERPTRDYQTSSPAAKEESLVPVSFLAEPRESDPLPLVASAPAPPSSPLLASPEPPAAAVPEVKNDEAVFRFDDRRYRVRGLAKNLSFDALRVNVLCTREDGERREGSPQPGFFVDTFDIYSARQRGLFVKPAAVDLGLSEEIVKKDLGSLLLQLEALQEEQIRKALEPKCKPIALSEAEQAEALELLRAPDLLDRILADFIRCGVAGEENNKLVGYLAAVSRKLEEPLAVILQSSSAAGKTQLMEAILALLPPEDRVKYSAVTGQALFYMGEKELKHKVLAIAEEHGAERASYALKLLQSEGELTIASTGKDPTTGRLVTQEYRVEGPVMIFLTTTAVEIDEELLNRCLVLSVDEEREQTRAIHRLQRERQTLEGLLAREEREEVLRIHRNAQRLLRPLLVANPFARELTFSDDRTRTRRDHVKYLTLIGAIALLHQYQRPIKTAAHRGKAVSYIEATVEDIAVANKLAHEVLGHSLDELPPQTRKLLERIGDLVKTGCERLKVRRRDFFFSRRDVREFTGWGNTQLKIHLHRLEDLEYLLVHRGGRGQSFVYELAYDGQGKDGKPFLLGLAGVEELQLRHNWSGSESEKSGSSRPQVGGVSGGGRGSEIGPNANDDAGFLISEPESAQNAHLGERDSSASYAQAPGNGGPPALDARAR
jgi:DNA primase catalytic core